MSQMAAKSLLKYSRSELHAARKRALTSRKAVTWLLMFEEQLPSVSLCFQLFLIGVRGVASHCTLESRCQMGGDGLHERDIIRSCFALYSSSEPQHPKSSSGRENGNYLRTA